MRVFHGKFLSVSK